MSGVGSAGVLAGSGSRSFALALGTCRGGRRRRVERRATLSVGSVGSFASLLDALSAPVAGWPERGELFCGATHLRKGEVRADLLGKFASLFGNADLSGDVDLLGDAWGVATGAFLWLAKSQLPKKSITVVCRSKFCCGTCASSVEGDLNDSPLSSPVALAYWTVTKTTVPSAQITVDLKPYCGNQRGNTCPPRVYLLISVPISMLIVTAKPGASRNYCCGNCASANVQSSFASTRFASPEIAPSSMQLVSGKPRKKFTRKRELSGER
mgnify:CR=1 FL=1|jgi:hypothetical protein